MIVCCKYNMPNNTLLSTKITSLVVVEWKAKRPLQTLFDLAACIKQNHSPQNLCPTIGIDLLIDLICFPLWLLCRDLDQQCSKNSCLFFDFMLVHINISMRQNACNFMTYLTNHTT